MYVLLLCPIFVAVGISSFYFDGGNDVGIIIRGEKAKTSDWPFLVFISVSEPNGSLIRCTGTVVTADKVLTACHCIAEFNGKGEPVLRDFSRFVAKSGAAEINSSEMQERRVKEAYVHPLCHDNRTLLDAFGKRSKGGTYEYDLGHFVVDTAFNLTQNLQTAKFLEPRITASYRNLTEELVNNSTCMIGGWGCTKAETVNNGIVYANESFLKSAPIRILSSKECKNMFCQYLPNNVTCYSQDLSDLLCVSSTEPNASAVECPGDSGAPLLCNGTVLGTASYGVSGDSGLPYFFSYVSVYVEQLFSDHPSTTLWKFTGNESDLKDLPSNLTVRTGPNDTTAATYVPIIPPPPPRRFSSNGWELTCSSGLFSLLLIKFFLEVFS